MLPSSLIVLLHLRGSEQGDVYLGVGSLVLMALVVARIWDLLGVLAGNRRNWRRWPAPIP